MAEQKDKDDDRGDNLHFACDDDHGEGQAKAKKKGYKGVAPLSNSGSGGGAISSLYLETWINETLDKAEAND